ncbi:MAG: methyltransferase domain-containing protein [Myxococcales bacterium]
MHVTHCPAHPTATLTPLFTARDRFWGFDGSFSYCRCDTCRSWVLSPRPDPQDLGRYYAGYYNPEMIEVYERTWREQKPEQAGMLERARASQFVACIRKLEVPLTPETRLLDAGCGLGSFARFVREDLGIQVRGVDFDPACRAFAASTHGVEIDAGELHAQRYPSASFDLVTSWHCMEHVLDPRAELAEMARITKPGGVLMVEVPTITLLARIFRGRWLFLQAPTHLYHFRPRALRELVEGAGFDTVEVSRPWLPSELAGSLVMLLTGVVGFAPRLHKKMVGATLVRTLFILLLLLDLPVTLLLALMGDAGVVRIVARRRNAEVAEPS